MRTVADVINTHQNEEQLLLFRLLTFLNYALDAVGFLYHSTLRIIIVNLDTGNTHSAHHTIILLNVLNNCLK